MNLLEAINIGHQFDYKLFENINLTLKPKESIAILGVSGSGKSTLLHILSSFTKPNEGEVVVDGKSLYKIKSKELETLRRESLGIIFQQHYLFRGFTGLDNLLTSSLLAGEPIDNSLLEKLGIVEVIKQNGADLSGGQQQRVSVARVLTKKPKIIFADEPTGNLDKSTAKDVMTVTFEYLKDNSAGMFMVTHDEQLARECNKVFLLEDRELKLL